MDGSRFEGWRKSFWTVLAAGGLFGCGMLHAGEASEVSQYGITWTFDKAYPVGQFVNGDWWVVGPVTVVSVTPMPGPAGEIEQGAEAKSRYGASALRDDRRMRNGSMIVTDARLLPLAKGKAQPDPGSQQGYDSRPLNYDERLSVGFPCQLGANRSLISTISSTAVAPGKDGALQISTPSILGAAKFPLCSPALPLALETAAILTCLDRVPPDDAFRPPYAGTEKPIYQAKSLQWDRLPSLKPVASTPDWATMERIFARPWIDHINSWLIQNTAPGQNQPNYGREFARMTSIAGLMLLLDVPQEQKRKLMVEYVQLGIDLSGLAKAGRQWFSDGGHWQGRKWPILFASLMLDQPELRAFPPVDSEHPLYGRFLYDSTGAPATTLFQEDIDTYYGKGGDGQTTLWQVGSHTGPRPTYQEKARASFDKGDLFVDAYQANNASSWIGAALAAQWMKAKAVWNHDAFFDYVDFWMSPNNALEIPKWWPKGCVRGVDLFVEEMWAAHRQGVPAQNGGAENLKWVWSDARIESDRFAATKGGFFPNPLP